MRSVILILSACVLTCASTVAGDRQFNACSVGLSLRLLAEETQVTKGGSLRLAVEIRNTGREPRWVYANLAPGVWLHLYDASGAEVQPRVAYEHLPPPPGTSDFLQLRPDHSLTLHDRYPASELGLRPGRYTARIEFMLVPAQEHLNIPACSGWLHTEDAVPFEVVE